MQNQPSNNGMSAYEPMKSSNGFPAEVFSHIEMTHDGPYIPLPHVHETLELGYCHRGHGLFTIGAETRQFGAGDLVIVYPGIPHFAQNCAGVSSTWSWIFVDARQVLHGRANAVSVAAEADLLSATNTAILTPSDDNLLGAVFCSMLSECERQSSLFNRDVKTPQLAALPVYPKAP